MMEYKITETDERKQRESDTLGKRCERRRGDGVRDDGERYPLDRDDRELSER